MAAITQENSSTTPCNDGAVHYSFHTTETRRRHTTVPTTPVQRQRCTLVVASMADGEPLRIPCYYCAGFPRGVDYSRFYHKQLTSLVHSHFPNITDCSAAKVAETLINSVVFPAHDTLHCPYHPLEGNDPAFTTFYRVEIDVRPAFVRPEIALDCAICLEEMTRGAVKMPCSHVFHKDCLVKWLNQSNVCPLCRHEIYLTN